MERSLRKIYLHFVWTTKHRKPILRGPLERFVHRRIRQYVRPHRVDLIAVNSAWNHIHVLAPWHTTAVISKVLKEWKGRISREWNESDAASNIELKWQTGSGVFSVSAHELDRLKGYIAKQKRHHREGTVVHRYERRYGTSVKRGGARP